MQYRQLGHSSLHLSALGLGTMTWGRQNTAADGFAQMDYALEHGINFFDTAEMYAVPSDHTSWSTTETIIGQWFAQHGKRNQVILATKVAGPSRQMDHIRGGPQLNRTHITKALEGSLKRLQTDVIDLYQIHWPGRVSNFFGKLNYPMPTEAPLEDAENVIRETLETLNHFIQQGKVRYYGLSNETPWGIMTYLRIARELGMPGPVSIQNPYSLLNRSFEVGLAEVCHRENIGMLAYSPLAFGMLTGKYHQPNPPENARLTLFKGYTRYTGERARAAAAEYAQVAKQFAISPTELALQFVSQQPFVTSNLIGATNLEQLQENIGSLQCSYTEEMAAAVEKVFLRYQNPAP